MAGMIVDRTANLAIFNSIHVYYYSIRIVIKYVRPCVKHKLRRGAKKGLDSKKKSRLE